MLMIRWEAGNTRWGTAWGVQLHGTVRTYRGIVAGVEFEFFSMIRTPRIDQLFFVGFIIKVVHKAYEHLENREQLSF